jgi:hypothetical protein
MALIRRIPLNQVVTTGTVTQYVNTGTFATTGAVTSFVNTGTFATTGAVTNYVNTGTFPTTGQVNSYINTSSLVNTGQTGNFLDLSYSGYAANLFVTTGQTGAFGGNIATGNFVTTSQTGQFAPSGSYVFTNETGSFVTTAQTGNFVTTSQTGQFAPSGSYVFTNETGNFATLSGGYLNHNQIPLFTGDISIHAGQNSATVTAIQGYQISTQLPVNGQTLQWDGSAWVPGSVPAGGNGGGGLVYYFNETVAPDLPTGNLPNTISGVYELGRSGMLNQFSFTTPELPQNNYTGVVGFISDVLDPQLTEIPAGLFDFNFWASSNTSTQTIVKLEVYKYDGATTTATLIASSDDIYTYDGAVSAQYIASVVLPQTTIASTDRLYIRYLAKALGQNKRITFYFGGNTPSHVHTTFPSVGGSGLVKVINGIYQNPASKLVNSDVDNNAQIAASKIQSGVFALVSDTGNFITTSQTGAFAPSGSYVFTNETGNFVTTSQTGQFAPSGDYVTTSQTGAFAPSGSYVFTNQTGNFVTVDQTGSFALQSEVVLLTGNQTIFNKKTFSEIEVGLICGGTIAQGGSLSDGLLGTQYSGYFDGDPNWFKTAALKPIITQLTLTGNDLSNPSINGIYNTTSNQGAYSFTGTGTTAIYYYNQFPTYESYWIVVDENPGTAFKSSDLESWEAVSGSGNLTGIISQSQNFENSTNFAANRALSNGTSWEWFGYFIPQETNDFSFYTYADELSYFWIGDKAVNNYCTANIDISGNGSVENLSLISGNSYPVRLQWGHPINPTNLGLSVYHCALNSYGSYDFTGKVFHGNLSAGFSINSVNGDACFGGSVCANSGNFNSLTISGVPVSTGNFAFTGNYVTASQTGELTGAFAPTGDYVLANQTSNFVTTGQTGSFVTTSQTGQFAPTGDYVLANQTGNFITASQTGRFAITGNYITNDYSITNAYNQSSNFCFFIAEVNTQGSTYSFEGPANPVACLDVPLNENYINQGWLIKNNIIAIGECNNTTKNEYFASEIVTFIKSEGDIFTVFNSACNLYSRSNNQMCVVSELITGIGIRYKYYDSDNTKMNWISKFEIIQNLKST